MDLGGETRPAQGYHTAAWPVNIFSKEGGRMLGIALSALSAALSLIVIGLIIWRWKE